MNQISANNYLNNRGGFINSEFNKLMNVNERSGSEKAHSRFPHNQEVLHPYHNYELKTPQKQNRLLGDPNIQRSDYISH